MAVYSERYRYIFFANPQTGSKAIAKTLATSLEGKSVPGDAIVRNGKVIVKAHHATYQQLVDGGVMSEAQLGGLFKLTGVRNPYDLLVSRYIKRKGRFVNEPDKYRWAHENPKIKASMEAAQELPFPEWLAGQLGRLNERERTVRGPMEYLDHADHVIRFEALQAGFDTFLQHIGYTQSLPIVSFNVTAERRVPSENNGKDGTAGAAENGALASTDEGTKEDATPSPSKQHYTSFYDDASRALVARIYAPIIERFGYTFDPA